MQLIGDKACQAEGSANAGIKPAQGMVSTGVPFILSLALSLSLTFPGKDARSSCQRYKLHPRATSILRR